MRILLGSNAVLAGLRVAPRRGSNGGALPERTELEDCDAVTMEAVALGNDLEEELDLVEVPERAAECEMGRRLAAVRKRLVGDTGCWAATTRAAEACGR
jgi:hypothetical protein